MTHIMEVITMNNHEKPFVISMASHMFVNICCDKGDILYAEGMLDGKPVSGVVEVVSICPREIEITIPGQASVMKFDYHNTSNNIDGTRGRKTCLAFSFPLPSHQHQEYKKETTPVEVNVISPKPVKQCIVAPTTEGYPFWNRKTNELCFMMGSGYTCYAFGDNTLREISFGDVIFNDMFTPLGYPPTELRYGQRLYRAGKTFVVQDVSINETEIGITKYKLALVNEEPNEEDPHFELIFKDGKPEDEAFFGSFSQTPTISMYEDFRRECGIPSWPPVEESEACYRKALEKNSVLTSDDLCYQKFDIKKLTPGCSYRVESRDKITGTYSVDALLTRDISEDSIRFLRVSPTSDNPISFTITPEYMKKYDMKLTRL